MSAPCLLHLRYIHPTRIALLVFLHRFHVDVAVKTANRVHPISQNRSSQGTSGRVHLRHHFPFLSFGIEHLDRSERLIVFPTKSTNRINFVVFSNRHSQLIPYFMHGLSSFPLTSIYIQSLYCIQNTIAIVASNKVKLIFYSNDCKTTAIFIHRAKFAPLTVCRVVNLGIIHSFFSFFTTKQKQFFTDSNRTEFRSICS